MPTFEFKTATSLQDRVIADDVLALKKDGIERFSQEALPYYSMWTRQDVVLVVSLLTSIATYTRYSTILLLLITLYLFRGFL
jgi:hypothetical protein